jgi:tRNA 2-thiouridine synthesizing protein A
LRSSADKIAFIFFSYKKHKSMSHYTLDARNSLCPMPVIKTQNKIAELQAGDILEVTCTDPGALNDIPAWCRINGHLVKESREDDDEVVIVIQVAT